MDLHAARRLQEAFHTHAGRLAGTAPVAAALCRGLAEDSAAADLFSRFYRITSLERPDVPLLIAGLHHLALAGAAPDLAAVFPTCGGSAPTPEAVTRAAAEALAAEWETVLDYMLTQELQPHLVERSAAVAAGAAAVADLFGGGVSLVEAGCSGGLNLFPDRYTYRFGDRHLGSDEPPVIAVEARGQAPALTLPVVVGRTGLDLVPRDLQDPADRLVVASFFLPDAVEQMERFRRAAERLTGSDAPDIRQGAAETDLVSLLFEAYSAMPPGNTLLLVQTYLWPYMTDPQRQQMTWGVQRLAASLQPHKPLAWLQLEPMAGGGGSAELKLQTFGWLDQEDRTVRRLAEADPALRWINWLE